MHRLLHSFPLKREHVQLRSETVWRYTSTSWPARCGHWGCVWTWSVHRLDWCCGRGQWDILCVNTSRVVPRRGNCSTPDVVNVTFHHSAMWKLCIMYMHIIMHVHTRRNFQRGDILYDKGKLCYLIIWSFHFYILCHYFSSTIAVTVFLSCELDTLCELWHFDVYKLLLTEQSRSSNSSSTMLWPQRLACLP